MAQLLTGAFLFTSRIAAIITGIFLVLADVISLVAAAMAKPQLTEEEEEDFTLEDGIHDPEFMQKVVGVGLTGGFSAYDNIFF